MANHSTKIEVGDSGWFALCSCRARSVHYLNKQQAEDWVFEHINMVERVKAHLRRRVPKLEDQRDYYREMQNAADTPDGDRPLWRQLADELDHRLNDQGNDDEAQPRLL